MYINKNFSVKSILIFSGAHLIWLTAWATTVTLFYKFSSWELTVSWLPISVIGTAVAFYVGFKNNQAYDRLWEARKIWGAIVNSSRAWGSTVKAYVSNHFANKNHTEHELHAIKQRLIYRHIAWLYTLRNQLLIPTPWEHISQGRHMSNMIEKRKTRWGLGLLDDGETKDILQELLDPAEYKKIIEYHNSATQLIDKQSEELAELRTTGLIEDFRHMELQNILNDFYVHQGKCERIKKFPLPRQYGSMSFIFIGLFIALLPFGMASEFQDIGTYGVWLTIPFTVIVGWVYLMMELVGDYSENPFEGLGNDIPMFSLCRTIEIDLREMLRETKLPPPVEAKNGVLM